MYKTNGRLTASWVPLVTAAAAGLVATAVTGVADRLLKRLVSDEQKRRDRLVRKGTAHELAGPYFAEKITKKELSEKGKKRARATFSIAYSLVWGMIYASLRKKYPKLSRIAGVPFAVPFFFVCDGLMAPMLGISPNLKKIPWQPSAKEMANHVTWTAAAEMVHRAAGR
jgi:putative membrane protein